MNTEAKPGRTARSDSARDGPSLAAVTITVIGSGTDEHPELSEPVGELLARHRVNLLTGGGGGVMRAVSRAFTQKHQRGISIGVIPCESEAEPVRPRRGYPNEFVELAIFTHLPYSGREGLHELSRNHINVLSAHGVIALPGGFGTVAEVTLALRYGKPILAFAHDPTLLADFSSTMPRTASLDEVEHFIATLAKSARH